MPEPLSLRLMARLAAEFGSELRAQRLCVGYSGGLDSTVLLHALSMLRREGGFALSAAHVHHGLHPDADAWSAHCAQMCRFWNVPLTIHRVSVPRDTGKGLEAAARDARHAVFAGVDADWIILAHHRDDQAETVLHHLLRGAGVSGAAGMPARDPARRLLRPLLDESRAEVRLYAHSHSLSWVEDGSNSDARFTRNHLRLEVMPLLNGRQPGAATNLARAAGHFREADGLLAELAREDWARMLAEPHSMRARLSALGDARLRNLLRWLLRDAGEQAPSAARLEDVIRQLRGDAPLHLHFGRHFLCAWQGRVWLEPESESPLSGPCSWHGEAWLPWSAGRIQFMRGQGEGALRLPLDGSLRLDRRGLAMRLRTRAGGPARDLRKLCQERGVPPWMRDALPVLWHADEPVWVGAVGAAAGYLCNHDEPGWIVSWQP